jgi:hypothetical protein
MLLHAAIATAALILFTRPFGPGTLYLTCLHPFGVKIADCSATLDCCTMACGVHGVFRALIAAGALEGTLPVGPSVAPTDTVGACHLRIAMTAAPGSGALALPGIGMAAIVKVPVRSTVEGVATGAAAMATVVATAALGIVTVVVALAASGAAAAEEAAAEAAAAEMAATTVATAASAIGTGTATAVARGASGVPVVETTAAESMTVTRSVGGTRTVGIAANGILHPLEQALLRRTSVLKAMTRALTLVEERLRLLVLRTSGPQHGCKKNTEHCSHSLRPQCISCDPQPVDQYPCHKGKLVVCIMQAGVL